MLKIRVKSAHGAWLAAVRTLLTIVPTLLTIAIFGIVWQSARAVFTRLLDGVEPHLIDEIHHAVEHVPEVKRVTDVRARWLGHELAVELTIGVDGTLPVAETDRLVSAVRGALADHLPTLHSTRIEIGS